MLHIVRLPSLMDFPDEAVCSHRPVLTIMNTKDQFSRALVPCHAISIPAVIRPAHAAMSLPFPPWTVVLSVLASVYLLFVRLAQRRRDERIHRAHATRTAVDLTPAEAQDIMHASIVWEMPWLMTTALSFAIVRTYAIVRLFPLFLLFLTVKADVIMSPNSAPMTKAVDYSYSTELEGAQGGSVRVEALSGRTHVHPRLPFTDI